MGTHKAEKEEPQQVDVPYAHISVQQAVMGWSKMKEMHTDSSDQRARETQKPVDLYWRNTAPCVLSWLSAVGSLFNKT